MFISWGNIDIAKELREIRNILERQDRTDMATNDELRDIGAKLDEATTELSGLPAEIERLIAAAGDQADPELVASLRAKATVLADIVPNAAPETPADDGGVPDTATDTSE